MSRFSDHVSTSEEPKTQTTTHEELRESEKREKKKKRKKSVRKRADRKETVHQFEFLGMGRVILDDNAQELLNIVVGENVTGEKPWRRVKKYMFEENIAFEDVPPSFQTFLAYKQEILDYPGDTLLMGYISDEKTYYDEFYICLNLKAEEEIIEKIKELEEVQKKRLNNSIYKVVRPWRTFGSGNEVDENIPCRHRGLYKVELQTNYPIMHGSSIFKERTAEAARDGYVECTVPARIQIVNTSKKLIHNGAQITPSYQDREQQTCGGVPVNAWTQYEYICHEVKKFKREFLAQFSRFAEKHLNDIETRLYLNNHINLYENDYVGLNSKKTNAFKPIMMREYMSFKDIQRCKDKMISAISWHPMWTGIAAIAYANESPIWYSRTKSPNEINELVHGFNPVLIWSFNDALSPKLILETTSEVHCLAFCPHDENILIGGCKNGMLVVWDITNKLSKAEEIEVLSTEQALYRTQMFSMMTWMKNIKDLSKVPITATTEIAFKHTSAVTAISWVHPLFEIEKTGNIMRVSEDNLSMQFLTASTDGLILIWDLKQKPVTVAGDYKPIKKSRRLKRRPSALTLDVSPYRILHRKIRPHYKIKIELPPNPDYLPVRSASFLTNTLNYIEIYPDPKRKFNIAERYFFKLDLKNSNDTLHPELIIGTSMGDFFLGGWKGYEYLSGDVVTEERIAVINDGRYHDGPIACARRHPKLKDLFLTIGGKVFAIWNRTLKGHPIMWRKSKFRYTHGDWSQYKYAGIRINRSDGIREVWNFETRTDTFHYICTYTGKALLHGTVHPFKMPSNVMGLADDKGALRIVHIVGHLVIETDTKYVKKLFKNNDACLDDYLTWQERWNEKYASYIKKQKEEAAAELARRKEEEEKLRLLQEEREAADAAERARHATAALRPQPGGYEEWAKEQFMCREQDRMGNILLALKRLDKKTLIQQQTPLIEFEAEEEKKRGRQRVILAKGVEIFETTTRMMFPDLVEDIKIEKKRKISTDEALTDEALTDFRVNWTGAYNEIWEAAEEFVSENSYVFNFKWNQIKTLAKTTTETINFGGTTKHSTRHINERREREGIELESVSETETRLIGFSFAQATNDNDDDDKPDIK